MFPSFRPYTPYRHLYPPIFPSFSYYKWTPSTWMLMLAMPSQGSFHAIHIALQDPPFPLAYKLLTFLSPWPFRSPSSNHQEFLGTLSPAPLSQSQVVEFTGFILFHPITLVKLTNNLHMAKSYGWFPKPWSYRSRTKWWFDLFLFLKTLSSVFGSSPTRPALPS